MRVVALDNKEYEVDYYGYLIGFEYKTDIVTSIGVIELRLRRVVIANEIIIEADLWQDGNNLLSKITLFRTLVHMRQEGARYRIIEKRYRDINNLWIELENQISNIILTNE